MKKMLLAVMMLGGLSACAGVNGPVSYSGDNVWVVTDIRDSLGGAMYMEKCRMLPLVNRIDLYDCKMVRVQP